MRIAAVQAGLGGDGGNSEALLSSCRDCLVDANLDAIELAKGLSFEQVRERLAGADAYLFVTGTYWDSWSSHLQRFLEQATVSEASDLWLGKPAGCIVSAHSVGGKGVLSRLQGVLSSFGALIPPMSGVVISLATQLAIERGHARAGDFWSTEDLEVLCHNVQEAARGGRAYRSWNVDRREARGLWVMSEPRE